LRPIPVASATVESSVATRRTDIITRHAGLERPA
jgi:hypothetical protein